jgi:hypothetical protein
MSLLGLIIALVVVGVVLYCINQFVPMDSKIKMILNILVVLILVIWVLEAFGLIDVLGGMRVPHAHRY